MEEERIKKLDEIVDRKNVSYKLAEKALSLNNNDLIKAILYIEEREMMGDLEKMKQTNNFVINYKKSKEYKTPLTIAAVGGLLLLKKPKLFAGLTIGMFALGFDFKIEKKSGDEIELTRPIRKQISKLSIACPVKTKFLKQ